MKEEEEQGPNELREIEGEDEVQNFYHKTWGNE